MYLDTSDKMDAWERIELIAKSQATELVSANLWITSKAIAIALLDIQDQIEQINEVLENIRRS